MKLRKLAFNIIVAMAIIAAPFIWLATTNAGLNAIFSVARMVSPVRFDYKAVKGKLLGQAIEITGLTVRYANQQLQVGILTFDWQLHVFAAQDIRGLQNFLPHAEIGYQDITIDKAFTYVELKGQEHIVKVQMQGHVAHAPLHGNFRVIHRGNLWNLAHGILTVGNNTVNVHQQDAGNYKWDIAIAEPEVIFKHSQGAIHAFGQIDNLYDQPSIKAHVTSKKFYVNEFQVTNLQAAVNMVLEPATPLVANITADNLLLAGNSIEAINLRLHGDISNHSLIARAVYKTEPITLNANGSLNDGIWDIKKIILSYQKEQLNGHGTFNLHKHSGNADLHGSIFTIPTNATLTLHSLKNLHTNLNMRLDSQNHLTGSFKLSGNKLDGNLKIKAHNLAFLMQWMPDVTRLKAKLDANINFAGTIQNPEITSNANITEITATIPNLGIKIKPMELHLTGDKHGKFVLRGQGQMRRGPGSFSLSGYIEPFKTNMPNSLTIQGNGIEFVNNHLAQLIGSTQLKLHFAKDRRMLDVRGDIEILQGRVTMADKPSQTVKSKDVVFVNEVQANSKQRIAVNPDLNLRIHEGVHFSGFGLDADVTGKLSITHRHDALYADGRVTIKKGIFQLPGQKLSIQHGRLLYPPGTLLVNPVLDIKMHGRDAENMADSKPDIELSVQGTAQKPLISENGLSNSQDRAISQALITGSSVISKNLLQEKLKISEIGLVSNDEHGVDFFDDPSKNRDSMKNKDFVVGRSLGKKFYVQYLHRLGEANQRVRLNYSLNSIWSIGVESGTQGGGADISFSIERD